MDQIEENGNWTGVLSLLKDDLMMLNQKMTVLTTTMEAAAPVLERAELVCFTNTLAQGLNQAGS